MVEYTIENNLLDSKTLTELSEFIKSVPQDETLIVLKFNIMGANVEEFLPIFNKGERAIRARLMEVHDIFESIKNHPAVSVAVVDGFALSGGFELALACDYRVATPTSSIGLPEVKLGIFPGWGGTVRLPRLIGFENAATWVTTGKAWKADKALKVGAIDAVSEEQDFSVFESMPKREYKHIKMPITERYMAKETIKSQVWPKTKNYPAPRMAVNIMFKSSLFPMKKALEVEARAFAKVAVAEETKHMVQMFFDDQLLKKKGKTDETFNGRVGVVGAGLMGGGIAYQSASRGGLSVHVVDVNRAGLDLAIDTAVGLASKRGMEKEVLKNINTGLEYDFTDADLVIEAVPENLEIKERVFRRLSSVVSPECIIATNTSSIPISRLAEFVDDPTRFVGIHFFSPVHKMPLVEIIKGKETSEETVQKALAYVKKIGKTGVVVNDCTSFFVNRVLMAYMKPWIDADKPDVSTYAKDYGWPMSPAELEESVGTAVAEKVANMTYEAYPHMDKMVVGDTPKDVFNLMMLSFFEEIDKCIEENIIDTREEARMACIYGIGFPPFRKFEFQEPETEYVPMMM